MHLEESLQVAKARLTRLWCSFQLPLSNYNFQGGVSDDMTRHNLEIPTFKYKVTQHYHYFHYYCHSSCATAAQKPNLHLQKCSPLPSKKKKQKTENNLPFVFVCFRKTICIETKLHHPLLKSKRGLSVLFSLLREGKDAASQLPPGGVDKQSLCSFVFGIILSRNVVPGLQSRFMLLHWTTSPQSQYWRERKKKVGGKKKETPVR